MNSKIISTEEVLSILCYNWINNDEKVLIQYSKELIQAAIGKISSVRTNPPDAGEDDYSPGKYMTIGMLYEFKEQIK